MRCASFIHVYYYDFIEELHKLFPAENRDMLGQITLEALLIPEGGDAASYFLTNPLKNLFHQKNENYMTPFFMEHFPEENGIYIDID